MDRIASDNNFAQRLIKLAEAFDTYDFLDNDEDDDEVLEQNVRSIEADLVSHNDSWIRDWLNNIKSELMSKIDKDDPDYIGHYLTECETLLQYLER